ncbi:MAG: hypothetical protein HFI39_12280 [Lachnospiraceae bacterium]|nr:hypothetical protein [Lachnospiraceae bacterium]
MKKWIERIVWTAGILTVLVGCLRVIVKQGREIAELKARIYKFKGYFNLTNEWLHLKNQGKNLKEYFVKKDWHHIAIYGIGELGQRLVEELQDSDVIVEYAIDKKGSNIFSNITIKEPKEELLPVDAIVVTPVFAYDEVEEALMDRVDDPIVSLEDVVFDL